MGIGTSGGTTNAQISTGAPASSGSGTGNNMDLLADLFGGSSVSSPPAASNSSAAAVSGLFAGIGSTPSTTSPPVSNAGSNILDLLGGGMTTTVTSPTPAPAPSRAAPTNSNRPSQTPAQKSYPVYSKNGFSITFTPQRDSANPNVVNILTTFQNDGSTSGGTISNIEFHAAVTKTQELRMRPASSSEVAAGGSATQLLKIANPQKVNHSVPWPWTIVFVCTQHDERVTDHCNGSIDARLQCDFASRSYMLQPTMERWKSFQSSRDSRRARTRLATCDKLCPSEPSMLNRFCTNLAFSVTPFSSSHLHAPDEFPR